MKRPGFEPIEQFEWSQGAGARDHFVPSAFARSKRGRSMPVVSTREFAIAAVEAEIARLASEPCAFDEMHVVRAIEEIR